MKNSIVILLVSLLILSGCRGSKTPSPKFYLLEYPPGNELSITDSLRPLPVSVEIEAVHISPAYASHDIIIREDSHQIRNFSNHRWASRPDQSLLRFVLTYYDRNKVFKNAESRFWKITPDYRLKTVVHQLEIVVRGKKFIAHLHVDFQLIKTETEQVVVEHTADSYELMGSRNVNLFAEVISGLFYDELTIFTNKAFDALSND
jgi:ABC-type uncharacterized transport system auxiliary subunit